MDTPKRFVPSGLNDSFTGPYSQFSDYVQDMRNIVERARTDLTSENKDFLIEANAPFEWVPQNFGSSPKKGILLIHGLYDSTQIMRSLGTYFLNQGFLVEGLLLPGHGTRPADLLKINADAWIEAVNFGLGCLRSRVDEVYAAGFSTGGALILYELLKNPQLLIKAAFLFAPACALSLKFIYLARFTKSMSLALPHDDWLTMNEAIDYGKYTSFTVNSLQQVYQLTRKIKHLAQQASIHIPMFWVVTRDDEVLNVNDLVKFFEYQPNPQSRMIYYSVKRKQFHDPRILWRPSSYLSQKIRNFSHVALPVSPEHPHYGEHGDYRATVEARMQTLLNEKKFVPWYGSLKDVIMFNKQGMARLTWNPDFAFLVREMNKFLGE